MKKPKSELFKQIPIGMTERHREMLDEMLQDKTEDGISVYQNLAEVVRDAIVHLYKNRNKGNG